MFADDTVVSGESRKHVGETRGTFYPGQHCHLQSQGQVKAWLKYNQLFGYHAQQRRKFVCNKITLTTFLVSIALKRCLSILFLS